MMRVLVLVLVLGGLLAAVLVLVEIAGRAQPTAPTPRRATDDLGVMCILCADQRYSLQLRVDGLLAQLEHAERTEREVRALYYDTLRGLSFTRCQRWYENHPRRSEKRRPPDSELREFCEKRARLMTEQQVLLLGEDFRRSTLFPFQGASSSPAEASPP